MGIFDDIRGPLQSVGVNLEQVALGAFGAVVDSVQNSGGYSPLSSGGSTGIGGMGAGTRGDLQFQPGFGNYTPLSSDLAWYQPKQKHLFTVTFNFNPRAIGGTTEALEVARYFTFFVDRVDKPKVNFVYEDVNMYNYRTKVLTKIEHQPLSLTFIDDALNAVSDFFNIYRKLLSPISRMDELGDGYNGPQETLGFGTDPSNPSTIDTSKGSSASMGPLSQNQVNVLKNIIIRQVYSVGHYYECEYVFNNPRIVRFDFDDVDHSQSQYNVSQVEFEYDNLYIQNYKLDDGPASRLNITPSSGGSDVRRSVAGFDKRVAGIGSGVGSIMDSGGFGLGLGMGMGDLLGEGMRALRGGSPESYIVERGREMVRNTVGNLLGNSGLAPSMSMPSFPNLSNVAGPLRSIASRLTSAATDNVLDDSPYMSTFT